MCAKALGPKGAESWEANQELAEAQQMGQVPPGEVGKTEVGIRKAFQGP